MFAFVTVHVTEGDVYIINVLFYTLLSLTNKQTNNQIYSDEELWLNVSNSFYYFVIIFIVIAKY